jgi:DNA modification methylase
MIFWWLLGAGVLGYAAYEYEAGATSTTTATTDTTWPPTKTTQQGLAASAATAIVQDQGSPLTADQRDKLAKAMKQAPNEYQNSLAGTGTAPTTSGYQAWFPSEIPLIEQAVVGSSGLTALQQNLANGAFGDFCSASPSLHTISYMRDPSHVFYYGDNLRVMRDWVKDETVDLVYLDPPFNSDRAYNQFFSEADATPSEAQYRAFGDYWQWGPGPQAAFDEIILPRSRSLVPAKLSATVESLRILLGPGDMLAYLVMMAQRLVEMRRVLAPTGSLFLHCDPTASHYIKLILDALFGPQSFENEIIWQRSTGKALQSRRLPNNHDVILVYSKTGERKWNADAAFAPYDHENLDDKTLRQYARSDPDGRRYTLGDLINPNRNRPNLTYEFLGIKRVWRWTRDRMLAAHKAGLIVQSKPGAVPRLKRYLDEQRGKPLGDVWTDIPPISSHAKERLDYPTQKPLALLERIIRLASREGDLVLDPFCGCGTTVEAAQNTGRRWIGIDITHLAVSVLRRRLEGKFPDLKFKIRGEPEDVASARVLAEANPYEFQAWIVDRAGGIPIDNAGEKKVAKKGGDGGIDGLLLFRDDPKADRSKRMILSVKAGESLNPGMVRDLHGTMIREKAPMGALLVANEPTDGMRKEALGAGSYSSSVYAPNEKCPTIQILSAGDLFAGKSLRYPGWNTSHKSAPPSGMPGATLDLFAQKPSVKRASRPPPPEQEALAPSTPAISITSLPARPDARAACSAGGKAAVAGWPEQCGPLFQTLDGMYWRGDCQS